MKKLTANLVVLISFAVCLTSQAHAVWREHSPYPVPAAVLASADEYVISKVGQAFFDSCITRSRGQASFRPLQGLPRPNSPDWLQHPRYIVLYELRVAGKVFIDETVVVNVKTDGGWFEDAAHDEGLPDCVSHPGECEFRIDENAAIGRARAAGLAEGRSPWRTDFRWFGYEYHTYAWEVHNELADGRGESVVVDANDGSVIHRGEWRVELLGHPPTAP